MKGDRQRVGEVSPSQLMYAHGIGSIIDLPSLSTLVMGLDEWKAEACREVSEPRLLHAVQKRLGNQVRKLVLPPVREGDGQMPQSPFDQEGTVGVPVAAFPRWQVCPYCHILAPLSSGLFELKTAPHRSDRARYVHIVCRKQGEKPPTIPARFMVACENGHLDDFPWKRYVHGNDTTCRSRLYIREYGMTGQAADVVVGCNLCNRTRRMSGAFEKEERDFIDKCSGRHPQLRRYDPQCDADPEPILLGASNSWFPILLSAVSIPSGASRMDSLLDEYRAALDKVESVREIQLLRQLGMLRDLATLSDEDIWEALTKRRTVDADGEASEPNLRVPEWNTFSRADESVNGRDFTIREVAVPGPYVELLERVLLVERLREVGAFLGFTRVESPGDFAAVEELRPDRIAPMSRAAPTFIPASEVRGEGIFLRFKWKRIHDWLNRRRAVRLRLSDFLSGHHQYRAARMYLDPDADFPGLEFVLLHSFSHALIRQLALECGYPTTSIAERIYSGKGDDGEQMAGILLYTSAPDSEGTLGGLVSLGRPELLSRHITAALETARICSSDPLCAEHSPSDPESHTIHGAACHACLFLSETSCERGNRYLDRSVLVETLAASPAAFFSQGLLE